MWRRRLLHHAGASVARPPLWRQRSLRIGAQGTVVAVACALCASGVAIQIKKHVKRWKNGEDAREPVARFLKTYSTYLMDHMKKEENFFDKAEAEIISKEEELEMYEQFKTVMTVTKKMEDMIKEIDYLENQDWVRN